VITVGIVVRAILWVVLIVAPGGIFLLPLLAGDAMARKRRAQQASSPDIVPGAKASQQQAAVPAP
jgi:hypothetical protein